MTRRLLSVVVVSLFIAVFAQSLQIGTAAAADETVAFNTKSLKYHCVTCEAAKRCTRNCIELKRSEAKTRGGVACKICGGTCATDRTETTDRQLGQYGRKLTELYASEPPVRR